MQSAGAVKWPNTVVAKPLNGPSRSKKHDALVSLAVMLPFAAAVIINFMIGGPVKPRSALASTPASSAKPVNSLPTPAVPPPSTNRSEQLQALLDSWQKSHPSQRWGVVVKGLVGGQSTAVINPAASFESASLYKLLLTYPLFKDYSLADLDKVNLLVTGKGTQSLKTCVDLMLRVSDNPCGQAVGTKVGWGTATKLLKQIGLSSTNLNNTSGLSTTSADAALFIEKMAQGELMEPAAQQYVVGLLQRQEFRRGIPAGCPGCMVADKIGDLGYVRHDVGIVQYPGGSYVLAVMTNGASYEQIAELTRQIQAIMAQT